MMVGISIPPKHASLFVVPPCHVSLSFMPWPCVPCLDVRSDVHPITCMPTSLLCLFPSPGALRGMVRVGQTFRGERARASLLGETSTGNPLGPWSEDSKPGERSSSHSFCETAVFTEVTCPFCTIPGSSRCPSRVS